MQGRCTGVRGAVVPRDIGRRPRTGSGLLREGTGDSGQGASEKAQGRKHFNGGKNMGKTKEAKTTQLALQLRLFQV